MDLLLTTNFNFRDYAGNIHFMRQLQREYRFDVQVFKEDENGDRTLLRVENPYT